MTFDTATVAAILGMAAVTYLTRIAGLALGGLALTGRARAAFDAIPAAVLTAVIAPALLATSWRETAASLVAIAAATRLPLLGVVAVGVGAIVLLRLV